MLMVSYLLKCGCYPFHEESCMKFTPNKYQGGSILGQSRPATIANSSLYLVRALRGILGFMLLITLVVSNDGCRSSTDLSFGALEIDALKNGFQSHRHVVLVCVYENNLQKRPLPHKHRIDSRATVVRSYKGTWQIGESIAFSRQLESVPPDWTPSVGHLMYLFLDEHSDGPIVIDTGDAWLYKIEFEHALQKH